MGYNAATFTNAEDHLWRPIESVGVRLVRGDWSSPISERPGETSVLGTMSKATGVAFDLPKDAEWEYACRAGSSGKRGRGTSGLEMTESEVKQTASYGNKETAVVGAKAPNAWGIYDLYGNVWEFCLDYRLSGADWYQSFGGKGYADPVVDPFVNTGSTTDQHVDRGQSYTGGLTQFRAAYRSYYTHSYGGGATAQGFRVRAPAVAE